MDWIKRFIYGFLKVLVRLSFGIFYQKTAFAGKEHLKLKGPTLVITNHPNTLVDALNGAGRVNELVYFLVNAGLFAHPVARKVLSFLFCIPIKRLQDKAVEGVNNTDSFAACYQHLNAGGHIFVAAEGGSFMERRLRPLKTGAARIALKASAKTDYQQTIRLLPMGLNYSAPNRFGSELFINVGAPLETSSYAATDAEDHIKAVRKLTHDLQAQMQALLISTKDEAEDQRLQQLEAIHQNDHPLPQAAAFQRSKKLLTLLRSEEPFREKVKQYRQELQARSLTDAMLCKAGQSLWPGALILLLGFPFFLFGLLNNLLPILSIRALLNKVKVYVGYEATVKILSGILLFPLFYLLQYGLVGQWVSAIWALVYVLLLFPLGLLAWYYRRFFREWQGRRRARHTVQRAELEALRREIVEMHGPE